MSGLENFMQSLLDFLAETLVIVVPVLVTAVSAAVVRIWAGVMRGLPDTYRNALYEAAELGADFAEVLGLRGRLAEYGHDKFHVAMTVAEDYMRQQGYRNVDLVILGAAIESVLFSNPESYHSTTREVG